MESSDVQMQAACVTTEEPEAQLLQEEGERCERLLEEFAEHTPISKLLLTLSRMKARSGRDSEDAYAVFQTGALNPAHRGHAEMLATAKAAMEAKGLAVVGGWLGPTGDWYVPGKAARTSDPPPRMLFEREDRLEIAKMVVEASPHQAWLDVDGWDIKVDGFDFGPHLRKVQQTLDKDPVVQAALKKSGFKALQVVYVMGDDHFRRCCSSWKTAVVVGRADITAQQEKDLVAREAKYPGFVYAPANAEAADQSSTKFRKALAFGEFDDTFCPRTAWDFAKERVNEAMSRCPQ